MYRKKSGRSKRADTMDPRTNPPSTAIPKIAITCVPHLTPRIKIL
jgi:hypothetical protein